MALQKQKIPLNLATPIDTKSDEYLSAGFANVENVRYRKLGGVYKRFGYDKLSNKVVNLKDVADGFDAISDVNSIESYNNELIALTSKNTLTYSEAYQKWINRDYVNYNNNNVSTLIQQDSTVVPCNTTSTPLITLNKNFNLPKYYELNNFSVVAAHTVNSGVNFTIVKIIDKATNAVITERQFPIIQPRIESIVNNVNIYGKNASTNVLELYKIDLNNPNIVYAAYPVVNMTTISGTAYDTITAHGRNYVSIVTSTSQVRVYTVTDTYNIILFPIQTDGASSDNLSMCTSGTSKIRVFFYSSTSAPYTLKYVEFDRFGDLDVGITSIASAASGKRINLVTTSDATNTHIIFTDATATIANLKYQTLSATAVASSVETFYENSVAQSVPIIYNNRIFLAVQKMFSDSSVPDIYTYFLISKDLDKGLKGIITAKELELENVNIRLNSPCGYSYLILDGNEISTAALSTSEIYLSVATALTEPKYVTKVQKLSFNFSPNINTVSLNSGLLIAGGITKLYDGQSISELGFLESPIITTVTNAPSGVGPIAAGTYGVAVVFSWTDNKGIRHRSAPALSNIVVPQSSSITVAYRNLAFTDKQSVYVEIYMTQANLSTYYKVTDTTLNNISPLNVKEQFSSTYAINTPPQGDTEILYTVSGELENDAAISNFNLAYHNGRLFALSKNKLIYSKLINDGYPVEFNLNQVFNLEGIGGDATAIYPLDNVLVLFKENAIFILAGQGPNNLGEQNDYNKPQLITGDVGCIDTNSVINSPDGLLFKSDKGIYLLNRGLYVSYIGAPVEAYNSERIISAELLTNLNEIRFLTDNNKHLVYDYYSKQWIVDTNINAISSVVNNNGYFYASSSAIYKENTAAFLDDGSHIKMKLETNWINLGGVTGNGEMSRALQGFQRLYSINILGKYNNPHELRIKIAYNYDDSAINTANVIISNFNGSVYGVGNYGDGPYGNNDVYQWEIKPSIQKCESFKIYIDDVNTGSPGESCSLSSFLLEIGIKGTLQKVTGDSSRFSAT